MKLKSPFLVKPHARVRLSELDAAYRGGYEGSEDAVQMLGKHRSQLDGLQEVFYASQKKALLIVLQGMDTAGKDGTIRHIFSGVNPQGCDVTAFKVPTPLETRHDFLWRVHHAVPPRGMIGIFNRSHYEDVLSPVVHGAVSRKQARQRMEDINEFESMLVDNDVVVLKFFLHISQAEQAARLQSRLDDKDKHWKLAAGDFHERQYWDQYQQAYEDILRHTSRKHAPWFVIPSDHKWYRSLAVSQIVVDAMQGLRLKYPAPTVDVRRLKL
jgi:PPK2 family polyphosphate:nucleotide phosphotransferase